MDMVPAARPAPRYWLHLLLLLLTVVTTFTSYLLYFHFQRPYSPGEISPEAASRALSFSLSLLAILGSHEMGHYVLARIHRVDTSLPYFIPLPVLGVGTLGAVIRIRDRIPSRNALVDIGAAGPLAGLVVALPILFWGLSHSTVVDAPTVPSQFPGESSLWVYGRELFTWVMAKVTHAPPAPEETFQGVQTVFGDSLLMKGLTWLALGPVPEGKDVLVHPVVIAGWFGLLVTLLNLMPIGQLDGGHLAFALLGRHAHWVGRGMAALLLFLTLFVTASWGLWLLVTSKVVGFGHPEVMEPGAPLSPSRKLICALCLLALIGCAMPVPLRQVVS
ncbi:M50 family peptidase [Myxococcus stipitatus DSM 14675]|uniref:M50 family peptidase n=1 Tax=Myxococcus stipitatus (strain DSM 14675 / JCM 12634 / Mx s8) TaxID=1278073 RepID=L7UKP8_MYXSD|nr:site-2 protease family protein [Myxococcus stipitatus]AGC48603.1 M50 family peptidase [Myxococcus stipitatus DSM 14675]